MSGLGQLPGFPLWGWGVRQADSQTLCLPQTKVWEIPPWGLHREIPADRENSWVKMRFPCDLDPFEKWPIYPLFLGQFSPVCRFQRRGGILTLPQRRNRHTGATAGFAVFHSMGGICFTSVFPATNRDFPSAATVFLFPFQYRRRSRTVSLLHFCCGCVTDSFFKNILLPQLLLPPCYTCDTFLSGGAIPDAFCLFPVEIDHPLLLIAYTQRAGILRGTGLNQSFLCHSFQKTLG